MLYSKGLNENFITINEKTEESDSSIGNRSADSSGNAHT